MSRCASAWAPAEASNRKLSAMNFWLVIAPALLGLPLVGLWVWLVDPAGPVNLGRREAAVWSATLWGGFASGAALLLSLGAGHNATVPPQGHLTRGWLVALWLIPALIALVLLWRRRRLMIALAREMAGGLGQLRGLDRYLALATIVCALVVGALALISAPTTWDSMTYHLARVVEWLQLGGAAHYASSAQPQLFQPPGAELLIAQLQALTGGDHYAALVQTSAYLLVLAIASLIAARLGGGRRSQLLSAFLAATLPMAIMQGSSTQNDLVVSLWLMATACLAASVFADRQHAVARGLLASTAVALAILTKGTAWIYLPPLLLLLAWALLRPLGWARFAAIALAGLAIVLAFNAGPWQQNHQTFGQYVYSGSGMFDYSNDSRSPATLVSNLVRNSAIYLGTPSGQVNAQTARPVRSLLELLGIDADSAQTTFPGQTFTVPRAGPDESHGPSILLFLLLLWAIPAALLVRSLRTPLRSAWALMLVAQILVFALLIKWQPWHSRLHLPVALLAVPLVAVLLAALTADRRRSIVTGAVVAVASLMAPLFLFFNADRPLIGYSGHPSVLTTPRSDQYFAARPELAAPYQRIADFVNAHGYRQVAMTGGPEDWYYPLSALLGSGVKSSYTLVANESARYPQLTGRALELAACLSCNDSVRVNLRSYGLRPLPALSFYYPQKGGRPGATVEVWARGRR